MKKYLILLAIVFSFFSQPAESANDKISSIISEIRIDSLFSYVNCLGGEWEIYIGENLTRISSRAYNHSGNKLAGTYLYDMLVFFGYTPVRDTFEFQGQKYYNIIVEKKGTDTPQDVYILCGHYDSSFDTGGDSPGADDNASGTATLLEAARILADKEFKSTIRLVFFNAEEAGLIGSFDYARRLFQANTPPRMVVNADMIAYDGNSDNKVLLMYNKYRAISKCYADWTILVNEDNEINLNAELFPTDVMTSDHYAFWESGMDAMAFHEDYIDINPAYHTVGDKLALFNNDYYLSMVKLAIGSVCSFADGIYSGVSESSSEDAFGVFPNPTTAYLNIIPKSEVVHSYRYTLYNSLLTPVLSFESSSGDPSRINISEHSLSVGFYILSVESGAIIYNYKIIISK